MRSIELAPPGSCITAIGVANTYRSAIRNALSRRAPCPRWAASATRTTTPWPRPSSGHTKQRSFTGAALGGIPARPGTPPWNGSMGSITAGCWSQSAMRRRRSWHRRMIANRTGRPPRPDSTLTVSGKTGAVHSSGTIFDSGISSKIQRQQLNCKGFSISPPYLREISGLGVSGGPGFLDRILPSLSGLLRIRLPSGLAGN